MMATMVVAVMAGADCGSGGGGCGRNSRGSKEGGDTEGAS